MLLRAACFAATLVLALTGCSMVTSYNSWLLPDGGSPRQGAGAYFLPKHILIVTITGTPKDPEFAIVRKMVADSRYIMNVGFNLSPTSDDDIQVDYYDGTDGAAAGIIKRVAAIAKDRTKDIIEALTDLIVATARFGDETSEQAAAKLSTKLLQVAFDPFNEDELWRANQQLRRFGFCVAFANDARHPDPEGCPWSRGDDHHNGHHNGKPNGHGYHDSHPNGHDPEKRRKFVDHRGKEIKEAGEGIFFRQAVEHKVQVHQLNAPRCKGWCPRWEGYVSFTNDGALLRVDVNRTLLVERKTTIDFGSNGVPTMVHVVKPSELLAAAETAVNVATKLATLPVKGVVGVVSTLPQQQRNLDENVALAKSRVAYVDQLNTMLANGEPVPAGHDIGGVLNTAPVRQYGEGTWQSGRSGEAAAGRSRHFQYCADIGLDRGGCEKAWKRSNPR